MDFKTPILSFFASLIICIQRIILLILYPYKTMRRISQERDYTQIVIIFFAILCYFYFANTLREYAYEPGILFVMSFFHIIATVLFFQFLGKIFNKHTPHEIRPYLFTITYAMIPTLIWFTVNSLLYASLPPPRNFTHLGVAFSVLFVSFSVAVLMWKIMLIYLSIRFSSEQPFYRIVYMLLLYTAVVGPYFFVMYVMKFSRIPFI